MKALAALTVCLGLMTLLTPMHEQGRGHMAERSIAVNYTVYRNAVVLYALQHPATTGTLSTESLGFPASWSPLRTWQNRIEAGRLYIYGPASAEEATAIQKLFKGSFAVGVNQSGTLVSLAGAGTTLPAFIPANNIVSVIALN